MEFSQLPEFVLLKIFRHLPLREQIRLGRVSPDFQHFSQMTISQTTKIDYQCNGSIQNMDLDWFKKLLRFCSKNLKEIALHGYVRIEAFSTFICPRLEKITFCGNISTEAFCRSFRNNTNLRWFHWRFANSEQDQYFHGPFDCGFALENLWLDYCNDTVISSFIGRCPSLENLEIKCEPTQLTPRLLDDLFAYSHNIKVLKLSYFEERGEKQSIYLTALVNFWNLPLVSLQIDYQVARGTDNNVLSKIAKSFRHLKFLSLPRLEATSAGVRVLASLANLKCLHLRNCVDIEEGIGAFANSVRLWIMNIKRADISPTTFKTLIETCPRLWRLGVNRLLVNTSNEAAAVIESIADENFKKDMIIRICDPINAKMWKSNEAAAALKMLEERAGHVIEF